jgi:hypothetical protein
MGMKTILLTLPVLLCSALASAAPPPTAATPVPAAELAARARTQDRSLVARATFFPRVSRAPVMVSLHHSRELGSITSMTMTATTGPLFAGQVGLSLHSRSEHLRPYGFGRVGLAFIGRGVVPVPSAGAGVELRARGVVLSLEVESPYLLVVLVSAGVGVSW